VPTIDRGMLHNYFHVCKQLVLCVTNQMKPLQSLSRVSHIFYKGVEGQGKKQRIKGKTMVKWMNLLLINSFII